MSSSSVSVDLWRRLMSELGYIWEETIISVSYRFVITRLASPEPIGSGNRGTIAPSGFPVGDADTFASRGRRSTKRCGRRLSWEKGRILTVSKMNDGPGGFDVFLKVEEDWFVFIYHISIIVVQCKTKFMIKADML